MGLARLILTGLSAALVVGAQQGPQLTARELFYVPSAAAKPAAKATPQRQPSMQASKSQPQQQMAAQKSRPEAPAEPRPQPAPTEESAAATLVTASYSGPRPLGLRYSILKRMSDQSWEEVSTDTVFRSGDKIRMQVESNEPAYLYIVMRGSSGAWRVLFPSREINNGDNHIEALEPQIIPSRNGVFSFDQQKGEEKLFLVLARQQVPDLERLIYDLNQAGKGAKEAETRKSGTAAKPKPAPPKEMMLAQNIAPIDDALVGRLRNQVLSRDLVFEKVDETSPGPRKEAAVYIVDKSGRMDARLIADIKLKHE